MFTLKTIYKSSEWENLLQVLKLERIIDGKLLCEHCGQEIIKKYDCIGHHKIELTEGNVNDFSISLNPENIILIHHKCHNIIHERFEGNKLRKVYIVYGSPCSGKSTWVNDVAGSNDLIVDMDKIWECISNNDKFNKSNYLKSNVFAVRDCLIDQIMTRTGMWKNAYVIGGYPLQMERERLSNKLGAELVYIECEKEICISRAINEEWIKYIEEWFSMYQ